MEVKERETKHLEPNIILNILFRCVWSRTRVREDDAVGSHLAQAQAKGIIAERTTVGPSSRTDLHQSTSFRLLLLSLFFGTFGRSEATEKTVTIFIISIN